MTNKVQKSVNSAVSFWPFSSSLKILQRSLWNKIPFPINSGLFTFVTIFLQFKRPFPFLLISSKFKKIVCPSKNIGDKIPVFFIIGWKLSLCCNQIPCIHNPSNFKFQIFLTVFIFQNNPPPSLAPHVRIKFKQNSFKTFHQPVPRLFITALHRDDVTRTHTPSSSTCLIDQKP